MLRSPALAHHPQPRHPAFVIRTSLLAGTSCFFCATGSPAHPHGNYAPDPAFSHEMAGPSRESTECSSLVQRAESVVPARRSTGQLRLLVPVNAGLPHRVLVWLGRQIWRRRARVYATPLTQRHQRRRTTSFCSPAISRPAAGAKDNSRRPGSTQPGPAPPSSRCFLLAPFRPPARGGKSEKPAHPLHGCHCLCPAPDETESDMKCLMPDGRLWPQPALCGFCHAR